MTNETENFARSYQEAEAIKRRNADLLTRQLPCDPNGKPQGRPPGAKNKRDVRILKQVEYVLNLLTPKIASDIALLTPLQRVSLWYDLQEYIRPKLARKEVVGDGGGPVETRRTIVLHAHSSPKPSELYEKAKLDEYKHEISERNETARNAEVGMTDKEYIAVLPETKYSE